MAHIVLRTLEHHTHETGKMKNPIRNVLAAALFACLTSAAQAAPIEGGFTPASSVTLTTGATPYAFSLSLLGSGFDPLTNTLTGASLSFSISGAGGHNLLITADTLTLFSAQLNSLGLITLSGASLAALQADGVLNLTIAKTSGPTANSFTFTGASLSAETQAAQQDPGTPGGAVSQVPEPGTLALLGLGLLGGVLARRRNT